MDIYLYFSIFNIEKKLSHNYNKSIVLDNILFVLYLLLY